MMGELEKFNIENFETVPMFIRNISHADPNNQDDDGNTVLHRYVTNHAFDHKTMLSLIRKGADLEIQNRTGKTAYLLAAVHRQKEMIELFIQHGANVNAKDNMGNNALHYMALPELNLHWETVDDDYSLPELYDNHGFNFDDTYLILEKLLKEGVDVNLMNQQGETPLMWAARGNHLEIVKMLLKFGANVDLQNKNFETCLHIASFYNKKDELCVKRWDEMNYTIMSELVLSHACFNCFNKKGRTALGNILLSRHANNIYFAWELLKVAALVNWRNKTDFYLNVKRVLGTLRRDSQMIALVDTCYFEIGRLKDYQLPGGSNLCQFALHQYSESDTKIKPKINDKVLEILLIDSFPVYLDFVLTGFPRSYLLRKVSKLDIYTSGEKRKVSLDRKTILKLSSYLENSDIFNLICVYRTAAPLKRISQRRKVKNRNKDFISHIYL